MIIVIASAKGGSGKTTTAMHLAEYLSRKKKIGKVALMDADPDNQSATHWYARGEQWRFELVPVGDKAPDNTDVIVVDAGAAPGDNDLGDLLELSDLLIVPTAPHAMDIESAVTTAAQFDLDAGDVKLLLTLTPPGRSSVGPTALSLLLEAEMPVCPHMICRRACTAKASQEGWIVSSMKGEAAAKSWSEHKAAFQWLLKGVL